MRGRFTASLAALAIASAAAAFSLVPTTAARADPIVFPADQSSSVYGEYWFISATAAPTQYYSNGYPQYVPSLTMNGTPAGYAPTVYAYAGSSANTTVVNIGPSPESRPLNAGTYSFDLIVDVSYGGSPIATAKSQPFTITPAAVGIEARIVADAGNPSEAVVSARFTGDFVEGFVSTQFGSSPYTPSGTWTVTITDASGEATTMTADRVETDDVLATSFLWSDAEPGEVYTVSAEFAPTGNAAKNFVIAASSDFTYTAQSAEREFAISEAAAATPLEPQQVAAFSVPLWWLVLAGALLLALIALLVVQAIRLRRPTAREEESHAHA